MNIISLKHLVTQILQEKIQDIFGQKIELSSLHLSPPPKGTEGDVGLPLGFFLSKPLAMKPLDIVTKIANELNQDSTVIASAVAPGFLNITFSKAFLRDTISSVVLSEDPFAFEKTNTLVHLEFVSANPTGPLHIGHGRWAALGDSLARILEKTGYSVHRAFYLNDAGVQIKLLEDSVEAHRQGKPVPEDGYHGEYVKEAVNSDLKPHLFFLEQQKNLLKSLGVVFDSFDSESAIVNSENLEKVLHILQDKGYLYEQDGATWFRSTVFGDEKDRVVKKSDGEHTYFMNDIVYHFTKLKMNPDILLNILGADHHGYLARIQAAVQALATKPVEYHILLGQLVKLFRNGEPIRMSKRTGDMISLEEVVEEIGVDATRFMLISKRHSQVIEFDLDLVREQTKENPVFYIQYGFARIHSILKKIPQYQEFLKHPMGDSSAEISPSERSLMIHILQFRDILEGIRESFEPHKLSFYLMELAYAFHSFYEQNMILENEQVHVPRLYCILATERVLKEGLFLLGIQSPEKM